MSEWVTYSDWVIDWFNDVFSVSAVVDGTYHYWLTDNGNIKQTKVNTLTVIWRVVVPYKGASVV